MFTQAESYATEESPNISGGWVTAVLITAVLSGLASYWWSGLALFGVALLTLAAVCITTALIITRHTGRSAWGMAILGQAAGVLGTAVLLWAALS
jgi:hypothetical protein